MIVLEAADLHSFDDLAGGEDEAGLIMEHPAELELPIRRSDRSLALSFASELRLAISEQHLADLELQEMRLAESDEVRLSTNFGEVPDEGAARAAWRREGA